ncbi:MAG: type 4a pilus biogenesis protein PilO [Pseudomonadales bacterium]
MAIADTLREWRDAASEVELDQIDWEQPGTWPGLVKGTLLVLAIILTLVLGYTFVVKAKVDDLNRHKAQESSLRKEYQTKAFEAANLDALRDQMAEMNQMFGALVSQLPSDTEVPGLIEDITAIGASNGLEIDSMDLQEEVLQEFYVELPIDIVVTGTYHDLGAFVSGIAGLPRIVTLHDFEILPVEDRPGVLQMSIVAKTYRYKVEG